MGSIIGGAGYGGSVWNNPAYQKKTAGASGTSGTNGTSGADDVSGTSGTSGAGDVSGTSGASSAFPIADMWDMGYQDMLYQQELKKYEEEHEKWEQKVQDCRNKLLDDLYRIQVLNPHPVVFEYLYGHPPDAHSKLLKELESQEPQKPLPPAHQGTTTQTLY